MSYRTFAAAAAGRLSRGVALLGVAITLLTWLTPDNELGSVAFAAATPVFIQELDKQISSGTTNAVTLPLSTAAGNLIVAYVIWDHPGGVSVSDSAGNTYTSAVGPTLWNSGKYSTQVFFAKNIKGGRTTVTATFAATVSSFGIVYAHEYAGLDQNAPVDVAVSAVGSSGSLNSGSVSTTSASDLLFGAGVSMNTVTAPGTGYKARATSHGNMTEDKIVSAAGSYNATASNSSGGWAMQMVAFRAAGSAGGAGGTTPDTTSPGVPAGLAATAASPSLINLSWNAATDPDNTSSQLTYGIYRNSARIGTTFAGVTSWQDTGLTGSTAYDYAVCAIDPAGNSSAVSASVRVTTPGVTIPSITAFSSNPASITDGQTARLSWTVSNATSLSIDNGVGNVTSLTSATVSPAATTVYTLTASNSGGTATAHATVTVSQASSGSYSTTFPVAEDPISEGGQWINGGTAGLDWHDCRTSPGLIFGTEPGTINYDDSTCVLAGSWGPNQTAQGTIHIASSDATQFEEVEVRLRSTITAHSNTGYEVNCSVKTGNPYMQIVRWNGPLGNFTQLDGRPVGCGDGDVLKGVINGSTISAYKNGTLVFSVSDSTFTSGAPGIGFYIQGGSSNTNADFGFSAFSASDGSAGDSTAPSTPANLSAVAASSSQVNLSWTASTDNVAVAGYDVFRSNVQIATTTSTRFSDVGLSAGAQYTYAIAAFDGAGNVSAQTAPVTVTTPAPDAAPPSTPGNVASSNITASSVTLTWSPSSDNVGVAGYRVFRNGSLVATVSTTSYTDSGLAPNTSYSYTVAAYDASNNVSVQSQPLIITSAAGSAVPPSFVQVNHNQTSVGSSVSVALNAVTSASNTLVAYVIWDNTGSVALTDSRGDSFTSVGAAPVWAGKFSAQVFYASNIAGGMDSVTASFRTSVTSFGVMYVLEYAGISTVNPVDVSVSASGSSSTLNSGSAATTSPNDLIFGAGVSDNVVTAAGSGFIGRDMAYGNIVEDRIAGAAGSYSATATQSGNMWAMQMVAFRPK